MGNLLKKRMTKNVITIVIIAALAVGMAFTTGLVGGSDQGMNGGPQTEQQGQPPSDGQQPPDMQNGDGNSDSNNSGSDSSDSKGSGNGQQGQPPAMPNDSNNSGSDSSSGNAQNGSDQQGQPPAMPNDSNNSGSDSSSGNAQNGSNQQGQPPEMPNDSGNSDSNNSGSDSSSGNAQNGSDQQGQPPSDGQQPENGQPPEMQSGISAGMKVLTGAEALAIALLIVYLIMSGFNSKTIKETLPNKKKIAAFAAATILAGGALGAAGILAPSSAEDGAPNGQPQQTQQDGGPQQNQNTQQVDATGATTVDGEEKALNDTYESESEDENAILVTNGGKLTSNGATINKKSGDGSDTDSCDFHGVNAGLLVNENSKATIKNTTIKTAATLSNGVFCTGEESELEISDSTIETTGERSCRGLDATDGGTIKADNVKITTQGGSCASLATDRGEGTVSASNSELETNGAGSPIIYSTGDISIDNTKATANGSQIAVVEGKNKATITDSEVTCSAAGNRGDVDVCGVMLYQSMSGDADEGTSVFKASGSKLTIDKDSDYYKTAPMFFVTNTNSKINLTDTELNFGSDTLLSVKGTSEWGNEGSNGGTVKLTAKNQKLKGDIEVDEISKATIILKDGSTYKGTINGDDTAKSIKLKLSKDSKIVLTGDTYVSSLEDEDSDYSNIDFNGHKLYVDGKAIN